MSVTLKRHLMVTHFLFILYVVVKFSNFVLVLLEKVSNYVDLNFFFLFLEVSHKSSCHLSNMVCSENPNFTLVRGKLHICDIRCIRCTRLSCSGTRNGWEVVNVRFGEMSYMVHLECPKFILLWEHPNAHMEPPTCLSSAKL